MKLDVAECVGPDADVRHFTKDARFTLCGRLVGVTSRNGPFESCQECDDTVEFARRGYWADFASSPGHVLVRFPS